MIYVRHYWLSSTKYEDIYMNEYRNGNDLYTGLSQFFENYNNKRRHSAIENKRPADLFLGERAWRWISHHFSQSPFPTGTLRENDAKSFKKTSSGKKIWIARLYKESKNYLTLSKTCPMNWGHIKNTDLTGLHGFSTCFANWNDGFLRICPSKLDKILQMKWESVWNLTKFTSVNYPWEIRSYFARKISAKSVWSVKSVFYYEFLFFFWLRDGDKTQLHPRHIIILYFCHVEWIFM